MPIRKLIAAVAVLALQASFAGAGEPGGTPDELYFSEAAAAGAVGIAFFAAGYAVGGDPKDNEGGTREKLSYAVYGVAPLASALAVYVVGENVGHPSANRGKVLSATAGTFYAVIGTAAGAAYLLTDEDSDAGALTAAFYTVIPAGFLGAAVYNAVKKPRFYDIPGYSITVEPSLGLCRTSGENGEVVPTWGVTVSF